MEAEDQIDSENHRLRAITKLHLELDKDIRRAVHVASTCSLWDLMRLIYEFRMARLVITVPELRERLTPAD